MKTIKESASELYHSTELGDNMDHNDFKAIFEHGVEFAQRWIPTNESMPEDHAELLLDKKGSELEITKSVLVKYENGRYSIDCRRNAGDSYNFWKIDHSGIIEWRPIERN